MNSIKYCAVCGVEIAREETTDYYRYIRLKYCPACAKRVHNLQISSCIRSKRRENRKTLQLQEQINVSLSEENELLRKMLIELRERIRSLEKKEQ